MSILVVVPYDHDDGKCFVDGSKFQVIRKSFDSPPKISKQHTNISFYFSCSAFPSAMKFITGMERHADTRESVLQKRRQNGERNDARFEVFL